MKTTAISLATAPLIGTLLVGMLFAPSLASAATTKPSCMLTVTTSTGQMTVDSNNKTEVSVNAKSSLKIEWTGTNVTSATLNGATVSTSGVSTSTPTEDGSYAFVFKNGSKKVKCAVDTNVVQAASLDADSLVSGSSKPTLSGGAGDYKKLYVGIYKAGSDKAVYQKMASVSHGTWKLKPSSKLNDGAYEVRLTASSADDAQVLARGTLVIGTSTSTAPTNASNLSVSLLPLLGGGTGHANASVPVMYLQVRNIGSQAAHVTGFTVREDGSASTDVVTMLTTVDDKGAARASSKAMPFSNGSAFVPTDSVISSGAVKIFTIKAQLGSNTRSFAGQQLMLNVTGVQTDGQVTAAFPVRGTTWVIAQ